MTIQPKTAIPPTGPAQRRSGRLERHDLAAGDGLARCLGRAAGVVDPRDRVRPADRRQVERYGAASHSVDEIRFVVIRLARNGVRTTVHVHAFATGTANAISEMISGEATRMADGRSRSLTTVNIYH
jgi:hypothetical protein